MVRETAPRQRVSWIVREGRPGRRIEVGPMELLSFLLFCGLCAGAAAALHGFYWAFAALAAVDGASTLLSLEPVISADRSLCFLLFVILSATFSNDLSFLIAELLLLIAALDLSLLLRRIGGTRTDLSVLRGRATSYLYTVLPAGLASYSLIYLYSFLPGFLLPPLQRTSVLALSGAGFFVLLSLMAWRLSPLSAETGEE